MADVRDEVAQLLQTWQAYWRAKDVEGLASLWDQDDPEPLYVAEEAAEPMHSHAAIRAYWTETAKTIDRIQVLVSDLRVREVAPSVALAFFRLHWDAAIGARPPIGGDVRVSAAFRRTPKGWRFFHYLEGPLAMLTQVRQCAESRVTPGF
ncbi:MAG: nuclear transport factor 2 family protein [Chloroflexota bacterium]|nr:nuclear transport factor 2 family protein [Dehalococcoidia bacterium]MDW8255042.1 nuclear transport factor 2 family protein [Chloroflexota bacterium]